MERIAFGKPVFSTEEIQEVSRILESGWVGMGPRVREFETAFAHYIGSPHALAVASGTAALHLALKAAGIGPGDEVITTAMTFAATVNAIIMSGATPVLVDCEPVYRNLDLNQAERAITKKTKAIMPVHFAGAPLDTARLTKIGTTHNIKIIHDCAHAIESEWNGKKVGAAADISCFSFHATKNLTTVEGGMICTSDAEVAGKIALMRNHGMSKDAWKRFSDAQYFHYNIEMLGYKANMTDVQAGLGLLQLKKIEERHLVRKKHWQHYQKALANLPVELPAAVEPNSRHAFHLFTIQTPVGQRDAWIKRLQEMEVGCGVHYRAIPQFSYYQSQFGWKPERFPVANSYGERTLSLPLTPYMTEEQIRHVAACVKKICGDLT